MFAAALALGASVALFRHARTTTDVGPTSATLEEAYSAFLGAGLGLFLGSALAAILVRDGSRLLAGVLAGFLAYAFVLAPVLIFTGPSDVSHWESAAFALFVVLPLGAFVITGALLGSVYEPISPWKRRSTESRRH